MLIRPLQRENVLVSKNTAYIILGLLNLLAFPAVIYSFYGIVETQQAIMRMDDQIPHDSGTYYLLLMSIFWVFTFVEIAGRRQMLKPITRWAGPLVLGWLILGLVVANIIPYWLGRSLTSAGYIACHDPKEISRVGRGESLIYQKTPCP